MTETWIPWAEKVPGPMAKIGYPGVVAVPLEQIEGEVKHSMEGSYQAALGELMNLSRSASWTFSLPKDGRLIQHYPLELIAWHAGLPGDRSFDTSIIGNMTLRGEEHEGRAGEPLTAPQLATSIKLSEEIRKRCSRVASRPPQLRVNLWEHTWLSSTACPSGRIPWQVILAALTEEEEMAVQVRLVRFQSSPRVYLVLGGFLSHVPNEAFLKENGWTQADVEVLPDNHLLSKLPKLEHAIG